MFCSAWGRLVFYSQSMIKWQLEFERWYFHSQVMHGSARMNCTRQRFCCGPSFSFWVNFYHTKHPVMRRPRRSTSHYLDEQHVLVHSLIVLRPASKQGPDKVLLPKLTPGSLLAFRDCGGDVKLGEPRHFLTSLRNVSPQDLHVKGAHKICTSKEAYKKHLHVHLDSI